MYSTILLNVLFLKTDWIIIFLTINQQALVVKKSVGRLVFNSWVITSPQKFELLRIVNLETVVWYVINGTEAITQEASMAVRWYLVLMKISCARRCSKRYLFKSKTGIRFSRGQRMMAQKRGTDNQVWGGIESMQPRSVLPPGGGVETMR